MKEIFQYMTPLYIQMGLVTMKKIELQQEEEKKIISVLHTTLSFIIFTCLQLRFENTSRTAIKAVPPSPPCRLPYNTSHTKGSRVSADNLAVFKLF